MADIQSQRKRIQNCELIVNLGLHRQSELTVKEPFRVIFGKNNKGDKTMDVVGLGASFVPAEEDDEEKRLV